MPFCSERKVAAADDGGTGGGAVTGAGSEARCFGEPGKGSPFSPSNCDEFASLYSKTLLLSLLKNVWN
ncbi:unnamed protein product [Arctia plantaginis]|uniref:Uncharacterized protein n=1 Tax=Arctia plantaginis TaxID=874455 RepID=A0A8S0ZJT5_ARCPL|nr:unnamed protein product [Arctia plantaginis]